MLTPAFSMTLRADGATILEPSEVIETDSALYLFDGRANELWLMPFAGPDRTPRLVGSLRKFGQGAVFALASSPAGFGVAGVDGRLRLMSPDDPTRLDGTRIVAPPLSRPLGLAGTHDGGWIIAHSMIRMWAKGTAVTDSTVVLHVLPDGQIRRRWQFERVGVARPAAFIVDRMAASGLLDTLLIVGASPARVIRVTMNSVVVDTLLDVPVRPITDEERANLREVGASERFPHLRQATLPQAHVAILRARPLGRATFVVARTGEHRVVLDLYCDFRFHSTVVGDTNIVGIVPGSRGATVLHEVGNRGDVRLDFIPWSTLTGECAP